MGEITGEQLAEIEVWPEGENSFAAVPPNAVLTPVSLGGMRRRERRRLRRR